MRRPGFLFIEAVLYLFLASLLAAGLFPLASRTMTAVTELSIQNRCLSDALFAWDYLTEQIRNGEKKTPEEAASWRNEYHYTHNGRQYKFYLYREKLYLLPPGGRGQPVTGDELAESSKKEQFSFEPLGSNPLFSVQHGGLTMISYQITYREADMTQKMRGAVLPYGDFYQIGEKYE